MSKKIGINKLMRKRKARAQEHVSFFPANMTLADLSSGISFDEAMTRMFGNPEDYLTLDEVVAKGAPEEFVVAARERLAEFGEDNVILTQKANGDFSIRTIMEDYHG